MFSNLKRAVSLTLLASAANIAFAAPAPVSDINSTSTSSVSSQAETDIQRLERLLNNRSRVQLQMQQQIDAMSAEISELRGMLERNNYDMKQMLDRQRELFIELDRVRNAAPQPVVEAKPEQGSSKPATGGVYVADQEEKAAYQKAVYVVKVEKDFPKAIKAFTDFQQKYPNSSYSANTYYWIGQLHFALKEDAEAVKSFTAVLDYKDSSKRPDSLVKLGDLAKRSGKPEQANNFYQQVITEYPDSASATMAKKKLKK